MVVRWVVGGGWARRHDDATTSSDKWNDSYVPYVVGHKLDVLNRHRSVDELLTILYCSRLLSNRSLNFLQFDLLVDEMFIFSFCLLASPQFHTEPLVHIFVSVRKTSCTYSCGEHFPGLRGHYIIPSPLGIAFDRGGGVVCPILNHSQRRVS